MCFKDSTHAKLVNDLGAEVTKAEVEQYQGIEVCAVEGVGSLKKALQGDGAYGFVLKADGDNVRVTGSVRAAVTYDGNIIHSFTFAGGIVSHEGGKVDGNTITINTGDYKLVGNPGSGKTSQTPSAAPSQNKAQPQQFASPYAAQPGQYPQGQAAPNAAQPGAQQPYNPNAQGGQGA